MGFMFNKTRFCLCAGVFLLSFALPAFGDNDSSQPIIAEESSGFEDEKLNLNDFFTKYENEILSFSGYGEETPNMYVRNLEYSLREFMFEMDGSTPYLAIATANDNGATLEFDLYWSIPDKEDITAEERYEILNTLQNNAQSIFAGKSRAQLKNSNIKRVLQKEFNKLAEEASIDKIKVEVKVVSFELH